VEQASRILICLAEADSSGMNLTEVSKRVGIHKSKAYSILNTLQRFGFINRDFESKTYSLGTGLLFLSNKVLSTLDVRKAVEPFLARLARESESTAFLGLISHLEVFVVAKDEGDQDIGLTIRLGHRFPLAWGAHGKAIVAFLESEDREQVLASEKLYFHGSSASFDATRLKKELAECRKKGFAVDPGKMQRGINAVASPAFGPGGKVIGSIVLLGTFPKNLMQQYGSAVARAAEDFSEAIGGSVPATSGTAAKEL
jgi:DNA-binding IclR family transcriptional regulator